jgi:hypothetical protein
MYSLVNIAFDKDIDWFGNSSNDNSRTNIVTGESFVRNSIHKNV